MTSSCVSCVVFELRLETNWSLYNKNKSCWSCNGTNIAQRECGIMIIVYASLVICMCDAALYIHIGKYLYNSAYTLEKSSKESNMAVFFVFLNGKAICNKVIEYLCGSILIKSIFCF
jgi:hypothetical protein